MGRFPPTPWPQEGAATYLVADAHRSQVWVGGGERGHFPRKRACVRGLQASWALANSFLIFLEVSSLQKPVIQAHPAWLDTEQF